MLWQMWTLSKQAPYTLCPSSKGCEIWKTDQSGSTFYNSFQQLERVHSAGGKLCKQESQQLKITSGSP